MRLWERQLPEMTFKMKGGWGYRNEMIFVKSRKRGPKKCQFPPSPQKIQFHNPILYTICFNRSIYVNKVKTQ